jgi:glucose-1-phosphatase
VAGLQPGAAELVERVRERVPVACLSNSNAVHWDEHAGRWGLDGLFDHRFLSHEIGLVKPDPEVFAHVVAALGRPAERLLFIDDNAINVEAAAGAGLQAAHADGVVAAEAALRAHGVLDRG